MNENIEITKLSPLAPMQEGMLLHYLMDRDSEAYVEQMTMTVVGELDVALFAASMEKLVERYDILRTIFIYEEVEEPLQVVLQQRPAEVIHKNLSQMLETEQIAYIEAWKKQDRDRKFDLSKDVLMRVAILTNAPQAHTIIWSFHHILMDGWCVGILFRDFARIYLALRDGHPLPDDTPPAYTDYIQWLQEQDQQQAATFWSEYLDDYEHQAILPVYRSDSEGKKRESNEKSYTIPTAKLQELANHLQVTLNTVFSTAWGLLLQRMNNVDDVVFGTVVSGRPAEVSGIEDMVGLFINTIPKRIKSEGNQSIAELLQEVQRSTLESDPHSYLALSEIQKKSELKKDLFSHIFVFENYPADQAFAQAGEETKLGFSIKDVEISEQTEFDFMAVVIPDEMATLKLQYNALVYQEETVDQLATYFLRILQQIADNPNAVVDGIELLSQTERDRLLTEFNRTQAGYPSTKTIHGLFEEQVARHPERIAVVSGEQTITYRELNERANQLARLLQSRGVVSESIVGIMLDRSIDMVVSIMAVLKAGGAYLPINPEYPQERITYLLMDSKPEVIITHPALAGALSDSWQLVTISDEAIEHYDTSNLNGFDSPEQLAYIIYTSGSTGEPKGVMIEHKNVVRLLHNDRNLFEFDHNDVWALFHSFSFDFAVWEMYGALLYGGKLVLVSQEAVRDPEKCSHFLQSEKVTVLNQTPSAFANLIQFVCKNQVNGLDALRYVIFGGEALKPQMLTSWHEMYPDVKLVNMYGITETTVHVTYKEIQREEMKRNASNIGKPIPTLTAYVMDQKQRLVPIGVPGELYVGGEGVARGYLNKPELTASRFVPNPYKPEERLYRSGDLVRLLPSGDMEYLGRMDLQVKIRGHRIELGEVENMLLKHPAVTDVVVLAIQDRHAQNQLHAFFTAQQRVTTAQLREHISQKLPEYMMPARFVQIEKIPVTVNGKVNRNALLQLDWELESDVQIIPPENETEEKLENIWQQVLDLENQRIGVTQDFFALGGDSIKVLRLLTAVNSQLETAVSVQDLYKFPTIRKQSELIRQNGTPTWSDQWNTAKAKLTEWQTEIVDKLPLAEKLPEDFESICPMSDIQFGMLYASGKNAEKAVYHDQMLYPFKDGEFNLDLLQKAVSLLVKKHSILRTTFNLQDFPEPIQIVHKQEAFHLDLQHMDITNEHDQEMAINHYLSEDRKVPFALDKPLWKLRIFTISNEEHVLCMIFHHAILDGWSVASFITELSNTYTKLRVDDSYLPEWLPHDYEAFILDQMIVKNSPEVRDYWQNELNDMQLFRFPKKLNKDETNRMHQLIHPLDPDLVTRLERIAAANQTNLKTVCFTAYSMMLHMLSYENDIAVGLVEHNRPQCEKADQILGCFLNTVPVRVNLKTQMTWIDLLRQMNQKMIDLKLYGRLPLFEITKMASDVDAGSEFFDSTFSYIDFHVFDQLEGKDQIALKEKEWQLEEHIVDHRVFEFYIRRQSEIQIAYSEAVLDSVDVQRLLDYYLRILQLIADEPNAVITKEQILADKEKHLLLRTWNQNKADYPTDVVMHRMFEKMVDEHSERSAVVFQGSELTYKQLNEKANQVARKLRERGMQTNDLVAVMTEPSIEMIIAMLAVLKAGGAYLPISHTFAEERVRYMLEDSGAKIFLTLSSTKQPSLSEYETILLDDSHLYHGDATNLPDTAKPEDLAYIIYTSGSTGKPKGVMVEHRNVTNFVMSLHDIVHNAYDRCLRIAQIAPFIFDMSVKPIYGALLLGHTLYIVPEHIRVDGEGLLRFYRENQIDMADGTPTHLSMLLNAVSEIEHKLTVKHFVVGGEPLRESVVKGLYTKFAGESFAITNVYGPTECTVDSTYYHVNPDHLNERTSVPIGAPLANQQIYILDQNANLLPPEVTGEIFIAGAGVARGYLNRPELTNERFVANPFIRGEKMYRTGDTGRWLPGGVIEYVGRIDNQVKIRGHRIEIGEIEAYLQQHEEIDQAVVIAREDGEGHQYLCAYIVSDRTWNTNELVDYLSLSLPVYMIPSHFVSLDKFPVTVNGKIDFKALPEPNGQDEQLGVFEEPTTETELIVADIWKSLLKIEKIGVNDPFFSIGGNSLSAIMLLARIHKTFQKVIPLDIFFQNDSIGKLAKLIIGAEEESYKVIEPVAKQEHYPTSETQKMMYLLREIEGAETAYNMPSVLKIEGHLNKELFATALQKLVDRHESLRTSFEYVNGELVQRIADIVELDVTYLEMEEEQASEAAQLFIRPFELAQAPLARAGLIQIAPNVHLFLFDMHHIISDGLSISIILRDFMQLYHGAELPGLPVQYKDFTVWQNKMLQTEAVKKQETYWLSRFEGEIPILNIPPDFPRPPIQSFDGAQIVFHADEQVWSAFRTITEKSNSTMFMTLLAAYHILLSKLAGQSDISVGTSVAGRPHTDLEHVVGSFINTLVLRQKVDDSQTFMAFLEEVRKNVLEAFDNQDYQFQSLVDKIYPELDLSRNPLFDTMFTLNNFETPQLQLDGLTISVYPVDQPLAKFDLSMIAEERPDGLEFSLVYATKLYATDTAKRIAASFVHLLRQIAENERITIADLTLPTQVEWEEIVGQWQESSKKITSFYHHSPV
ncbi:amino acid adenylation domain-containing protein [Brevibacillus laterosporus]|uniref:NRPS domain-containing protein n=1 Tax=Brevibacillus laterosporus LMG 15441 TaxID=1042163 RepID=A0A075R2C8_BRELA|nr:non-ribosomal peptide synthetase [Brevibacillus laterosporus]AIG26727.1 NRPS domain-containing protein [Brevibacillus laterosporus LMG 15441]RJL14043.1 non-ribosomal peptide synthetase [Brevibacillus laterosporus]